MDKLLLEIESIKKQMGINVNSNLLFESKMPPEIWVKLTKYFDDIAGVGEKELDELVSKGLIDDADLKWLKNNIDEIKLKSKNITNPANITDPTLKKFDYIFSKLSEEELKVLSRKAVSNFIDHNKKDFMGANTLLTTFSKSIDDIGKGIINPNNQKLIDYVQNGGKLSDLYRNELSKVYDGEVLEELVRRFKNDARFLDAEEIILNKGLTIDVILEREIRKLLDDPTYKDLNSLEKLKKLNELKKSFIEKTIRRQSGKEGAEKISEKEIERIVNEKIGKVSNEIETSYEKGMFTDLFVSAKSFRVVDEFVSLAQSFNKGSAENIIKIEDDISDIIVLIDRRELSESYYKEVADRIKVLSANAKSAKESVTKYWEDLQVLIKKTYANDPSKADEIIKKIGGADNLTQFFEKAKQYVDVGDRMAEAAQKTLDAFGLFKKLYDDASSTILKFNEGAGKRWINFLATGSFTSFKEWTQRLAQRRKFLFAGKEIQGFGWKSYFDLYCRIWFVSNIAMPLFTSLISSLGLSALLFLGDVFGIGDQREYYAKNKGKSILDLWQEFYADSVKSSFDPFVKDYNEKMEGQFPQTSEQWLKWGTDFIGMVIPFNTKLDDIGDFIVNTPQYFSKAKKIKEDEVKKAESEFDDASKKTQGKAKRVLRSFKQDTIDQLSTGSRSVYLGIKNDPNLSDYDKETLQSYSDGDGEGNMWITDPEDGNIKYTIITNPNFKGGLKSSSIAWKDGGTVKNMQDLVNLINTKLESRYKKTNDIIMENKPREKFGEDNFKHWKDTFLFKSVDEKNPGQYKEVKINMEDVMDRINHYRKKYDEDDAFVRAVIDTHEDVVKIMFTKDLAHIHENATPRGLALVLRVIKEERGELEIFSVARPANGNWFLVKGDYTPNQLANMDLEKKEPQSKEKEVVTKAEDDLKKKEESVINVLKRNEKEGIEELPKKVRDKIREKMGQGWSTETPPEELKEYFTTSEINSIFNDKIIIYKLKPSREFFGSLVKNSARIVIKRGFCRALQSGKKESELSERQKMTVDHILNKCNTKYESKLGLRNF